MTDYKATLDLPVIFVKSRALAGDYARHLPGWFDHGLPIELMVEKKVGKKDGRVDASTFHQTCREYAASQVDGQRRDFKRPGAPGRCVENADGGREPGQYA